MTDPSITPRRLAVILGASQATGVEGNVVDLDGAGSLTIEGRFDVEELVAKISAAVLRDAAREFGPWSTPDTLPLRGKAHMQTAMRRRADELDPE